MKKLLGLSLLLLSQQVFSADYSFSGYLKSYLLVQEESSTEDDANSTYQSQNSLRVMNSLFTENSGNVEIHYELQPVYYSDRQTSEKNNTTITTGTNQYRYKDINAALDKDDDHWVLWQNLDRFNYQYSHAYGDFTIGRQVVSFGSARFINPTDIFNPFALQTLNQEYRVGIDAIRFQAELGNFSLLDSGVIIGEDGKKENSALFLRSKISIEGNDIETMLIGLDRAWLLGGGLERALGDFGFWLETAYMVFEDSAIENYLRTSIGSDYAFNESLIGTIEYHYNGVGSIDENNYQETAAHIAYQKYGVYLLGKHYLIPAISWLATPLTTINFNGFININDQSSFIQITLDRSWSNTLYSDFGLQLGTGKKSNTKNNGSISSGSEFGNYPISIYASLRYYF